MPPVILARLLLHLGVVLPLLGLWLGPAPSQGRPIPASVAHSEADHTARNATVATVAVGSQAPLPRVIEGPLPCTRDEARLSERTRPLRPLDFDARQPDPTTRVRSAGPLYQVLRSGQAHRSAP